MSWRYRVGQFARALWGPRRPPDLDEFAGLLSAPQERLFHTMAVVDQRHCLAVARALVARGVEAPAVMQAALLHDLGKSTAQIQVWERVAHVLLRRLAPQLVSRVGSSRPGDFGHGLYVLAHHAQVGAALAEGAGASQAAVALLRGAGDPAMQALLQQTDDEN